MYNINAINGINGQAGSAAAVAGMQPMGQGGFPGFGAVAAAAPRMDGFAGSREVMGLLNNMPAGFGQMPNQMGQMGQMANQMGQAGQMDQQTAGMFNQLCTMFKSLMSQFQQWMNGGQNAAGQNGQNAQANGANAVNNNGQAVNQGKGYDGKAGLISGTTPNNSVYGPNGITMKPLDKYNVSSEFGNRPSMGDFHTGIDLAAPTGTPIRAMKGGTVTKVANDPSGYGNYVEVKHPDGSTTRYAHMSAFGNVKPGMQIGGGSVLGAVGSTGRSTGPHLHFEYRDANGTAIDPRKIMNF